MRTRNNFVLMLGFALVFMIATNAASAANVDLQVHDCQRARSHSHCSWRNQRRGRDRRAVRRQERGLTLLYVGRQ